MSDFDDVLERLLNDPTFQARLSADPQAALAGYSLDAQERELLGAQLVGGDSGGRGVETRTNKSGVIGLIGPALSAFGLAPGGGGPGTETFGNAPSHGGGVHGATETFGTAPGGAVPDVSAPGGSIPGGAQTFGAAPPAGATQTFGTAPQGVPGATMGEAPVLATDYHTHVDADGDGHWDAYQAYNRPDGGVDIDVDINHDGRVDFVGHDYNRDGLVDSADYDDNHDGVFDTRMYDDNGDGWMDRAEPITHRNNGPTESFGQAPK
jgi:hypothetical protein